MRLSSPTNWLAAIAVVAGILTAAEYSIAEPPATICEYDPLALGGGALGGQKATATKGSRRRGRRAAVAYSVERLARIDFNRDRRLTVDELSALGAARRHLLLRQYDADRDGQLTEDELASVPPEPTRAEPAREDYSYSSDQPTDGALEAWQYEYVRKMSWLAGPTVTQPRTQPFAQAATFGTGPAIVQPQRAFFPVRSGGDAAYVLRVGRCN